MNNNRDFLYFNEEPIRIAGYIKFAVLPGVINKLQECRCDAVYIFTRISALNSLLVTSYEGEGGSTKYKLHTPFGVFNFTESREGTEFLLLGFNESNFQDTNTSLLYGIRFQGSLGTVLTVKLKDQDWFQSYSNGWLYDANRFSYDSGYEAVRSIKDYCYRSRNGVTSEEQEEAAAQSPKLLKLLDIAESYSILANSLENKIAEEVGLVPYTSYEPVEYPRHDRVAYTFYIEKQERPVFSAGTNVDIVGADGETLFTAEIVEAKTKRNNECLTMLFTKEVDLSGISSIGWLRLSVSTVNMDVQLKAINRIRKGTSKAGYMNKVLGEDSPQGFDQEDLRRLDQELQKKKYPPNASQVSAIKNGINSKDVYLVMGPPGTGKTTVILEWVKYFVKEKHLRVLVSSQNNKAVDNVLERLAGEEGIDTIRIGSEAKVQEEVIPYIFENKLISLREQISDSTSLTVSEAEAAIKEWTEYIDILKSHLAMLEDLETIKQSADNFRTAHIEPLKAEMRNLQWESSELIERINEEYQLNEKLIEYKNKYDSLHWILQILLYLPMLLVWKKLDEYNEKMIPLVERQNIVAEAYNTRHAELERDYAFFNSNILDVYYPLYERMIGGVQYVLDRRPANHPDIGLYSVRALKDEEAVNRIAVQKYVEYILNEEGKARRLCENVSAWRQEITGAQNYALHQIILDSVDLVGATCIGVSSQKRFQDLDFDVTIIDEAGQIQIHNALVPMSVSNKLIMLGDHMQIPPNADQELVELCEANDVDPELLGKSLFEQMYYDLPDSNKTLLDTQYRMPAEIADIISAWFYDGEYKSPDFLRNKEPAIPSISDKNLVLVNTPHLAERTYEDKDPEGGYNNYVEAYTVRKIVEHILKNTDFSEKQIGIISAYKSQVKKIQKELKGIVSADAIGEVVASLDSFQGQERDIIIYSFTRSSQKKATQSRIGFLNELRRLNVAMTRCKKILIMVGDYEYLSGCKKEDAEHVILAKDRKRVVNGSEAVFSEFVRTMCREVRNGKGDMVDVPALMKKIEG